MEIYKTIHGVFNGQDMVAEDGETYEVNGNYASKSRFLEGDALKLIVLTDGSYMYKQLERQTPVNFIGVVVHTKQGTMIQDQKTGHRYRVLPSSVTYYRLREGDEVSAMTSEGGKWAVIVMKFKAE